MSVTTGSNRVVVNDPTILANSKRNPTSSGKSNFNRDLKIPRFRCTGTGKLPVAVHVISGGRFNLSYQD